MDGGGFLQPYLAHLAHPFYHELFACVLMLAVGIPECLPYISQVVPPYHPQREDAGDTADMLDVGFIP